VPQHRPMGTEDAGRTRTVELPDRRSLDPGWSANGTGELNGRLETTIDESTCGR
jgi:hypothetical protein